MYHLEKYGKYACLVTCAMPCVRPGQYILHVLVNIDFFGPYFVDSSWDSNFFLFLSSHRASLLAARRKLRSQLIIELTNVSASFFFCSVPCTCVRNMLQAPGGWILCGGSQGFPLSAICYKRQGGLLSCVNWTYGVVTNLKVLARRRTKRVAGVNWRYWIETNLKVLARRRRLANTVRLVTTSNQYR